MHFIFGDDGYKYGAMYVNSGEMTPAQAEDLTKKLITYPIYPNPHYDTYGYLSYGINQSKQLFYCVKTDTSISRGVYYIHGIFNLDNEGLMKKDEYLDYLLYGKYLDQKGFGELRSNLDTFRIDGAIPKVQADLDRVLSRETAVVILSNLYAGNQVVLSVEDENYKDDDIRRVIAYLFTCMPPALRKKCTFLTAVPDTGTMNIMLSVLPVSMIKGHKAISLTNTSDEYLVAAYREVAELFTGLPMEQRGALLSLAEAICFEMSADVTDPYDSKKFLRCCTAILQKDADTLCEMIRTNVERVGILARLPESIRGILNGRYTDSEYVSKEMDFNKFNLFAPEEFFAKYRVSLETVYLFDPTMEAIRDFIPQAAEGIRIGYENVRELEGKLQETLKALPQKGGEQGTHAVYLEIVGNALDTLEERLKRFKDEVNRIYTESKKTVQERRELLGREHPYYDELCRANKANPAVVSTARQYNFDFAKAIPTVVGKAFDLTNSELLKVSGNVKCSESYMREVVGKLETEIAGGATDKAEELALTAIRFHDQHPGYQQEVDQRIADLACVTFAKNKKAFAGSFALRRLQDDAERSKQIFERILAKDYRAAVQYCFDYTDGYGETYRRLLGLLEMCSRYDEQAMDQAEFDALCEEIRGNLIALGEKSSPEERGGDTDGALKNVSAKVHKSKRGSALYHCICDCRKMDRPGKRGGSPLKWILIGAGGLVGIAAIAVAVILLTKGGGGEGAETAVGETASPETQIALVEGETSTSETDVVATNAVATTAPETNAPATESVETSAPATDAVETDAPATESVETDAPATTAPETSAPATDAVETSAPATESVETESVETDVVETDAVETSTSATESVETESVETDAVATESVETDAVATDAVETEAPDYFG